MINVGIASDHAGFHLKEFIKTNLFGYRLVDFGTNNTDSVDYPDFAKRINNAIISNQIDYGILICGTGIGISIAANRNKNVRAALCYNIETPSLARKHNNANIIALGAKFLEQNQALAMIQIFLTTEFEAGRHLSRINKINEEI